MDKILGFWIQEILRFLEDYVIGERESYLYLTEDNYMSTTFDADSFSEK